MDAPADQRLPVSARLAWWGTAWLRGHIGPDDLLDAVLADDVTHVVVSAAFGGAVGVGHEVGGWRLPGAGESGAPSDDADPGDADAADGQGSALLPSLAALRSAGARSFGAAFGVDGDPVGLGGPAPFTALALDAGEAVVVTGADVGLVPRRVGPVVEWALTPAHRRQLTDVGAADRDLRTALPHAADALADLDVAAWRPEVADRLIDLRSREPLTAPPGTPPRCVELAARALQALDIVDLALEHDGGALTAAEATRRRTTLLPLERAARHALVAACSPEVWPPS